MTAAQACVMCVAATSLSPSASLLSQAAFPYGTIDTALGLAELPVRRISQALVSVGGDCPNTLIVLATLVEGPIILWPIILWQFVETCKKLFFVSLVRLILPGTVTQLLVALVVALSLLVFQLTAAPFVAATDNFLGMVSCVAYCLLLLGTLALKLDSLFDAVQLADKPPGTTGM